MWVYAVIVVVVAALGSLLSGRAADDLAVSAAQSRTLAEGVAVYRAAVLEWARSNPGLGGPVDETVVAVPAWWHRNPAIAAVVEGPMVAVYVTGPSAHGTLVEMLRLSGGSIWVGIANRASGTLHSPMSGDTGIAVPALVPDGAPVWLATRG